MSILVPYESSGQQLGETRQAMAKTLMSVDLENIINKFKDKKGKYYVLFHAKPYPNHPTCIRIKPIAMDNKPSMMLSCMLFGVDNDKGTLTLEWALPGDWPVWAVGGKNEPVPEVIASVNESGIKYHYENFLPD
jgi:hypothetical protein